MSAGDETFDRVRLGRRADGTLATRTLLDSRDPAATIVIDYDRAGEMVARHELNLPGRPYARVDIVYGPDGAIVERTRSGFAHGDLESVTVRFDEHGAIAQVEHRLRDGSRTVVGGAPEDARTIGGVDTFVPLEAGHRAHTATQQPAQADRLDPSAILAEGGAAPPFHHIASGTLAPTEIAIHPIDGAHALPPGAHLFAPPDLIL